MAQGLSEDGNKPFQHYSWKHRAVAWVSQNLFDWTVYTVRHGLLSGMKRRGGLGWLPLGGGEETEEHKFFRSLRVEGKTVYDVGAFVGLFSLYFSKQAARIICYEPNPKNRARLQENLKLNGIGNVTIRPLGAGSEKQTLEMVFDPLMPGGASVESSVVEGIKGSSGNLEKSSIQITTLDADIAEAGLPAPDLIKIDIEGFELQALQGAKQTLLRHRPALYLEMHGETMNEKIRKVGAIVEFLSRECGYGSIVHVESNCAITPENSAMAAQGHLYCVAAARFSASAGR